MQKAVCCVYVGKGAPCCLMLALLCDAMRKRLEANQKLKSPVPESSISALADCDSS